MQACELLQWIVANEPERIDPWNAIEALARRTFAVTRDRFVSDSVMAALGVGSDAIEFDAHVADAAYWRIYAYLFGLLPLVVKTPRVDHRKWSKPEYTRLTGACLKHWAERRREQQAPWFFDRYRQVEAACGAWTDRARRLSAALDCSELAECLTALTPLEGKAVRFWALSDLIDRYLRSLPGYLRAELKKYYCGAAAFGFFACSHRPLPPHIGSSADAKTER